MISEIDNITESELLQWIRLGVKSESNILSRGFQGYVYLYESKGKRLVIKAPMGRGLIRFVSIAMLRREHRVYSKLSGMHNVPRCYGIMDGRYIVLEYIDGVPIRNAQITNRNVFFEDLLNLIKELHKAGVAHSDLKKKDNLLVVKGKTPYIIDFGAAVIKKPGFAPLNRYLYNIARKFDFNAWVKLKYDRYKNVSEKDRKYYQWTAVERVSHWIKYAYLKLKKIFMLKR
jgi:predicted Ser/Thr protein kinase